MTLATRTESHIALHAHRVAISCFDFVSCPAHSSTLGTSLQTVRTRLSTRFASCIPQNAFARWTKKHMYKLTLPRLKETLLELSVWLFFVFDGANCTRASLCSKEVKWFWIVRIHTTWLEGWGTRNRKNVVFLSFSYGRWRREKKLFFIFGRTVRVMKRRLQNTLFISSSPISKYSTSITLGFGKLSCKLWEIHD